MNQYRVRVFLTESRWNDIIISADSWPNAQFIGQGQSPVGKAIFLGEVVAPSVW